MISTPAPARVDRAPLVVPLGDPDPERLDRVLGSASRALLAEQASTVVFDVAATDGATRAALERWLCRNDRLLRARAVGIVFVVPGWLQSKMVALDLAGRTFPTAHAVKRSLEEAVAWASARQRCAWRG